MSDDAGGAGGVAIIWAIFGGIVGAVVGFVGAAFLSSVIMGWQGVSDFEGQRGMAAALVFGPLGGLTGLGLGIWLALRLARGRRGIVATAKQGGVALLGIAAIVGIVLFVIWQSGDRHLNYDGAGATLEFEIRVPAGFALPPAADGVSVDLSTDKNQQPGYLSDPWLRRDGEWQVIAGGVELYFRTSQRLLVLQLGDGRDRLFRIRLPAKPDPDAGWGEWQKVDFIGIPDQPQTVPPGPEVPFEIRYHIRVWGR
jgi:hypothetical protein